MAFTVKFNSVKFLSKHGNITDLENNIKENILKDMDQSRSVDGSSYPNTTDLKDTGALRNSIKVEASLSNSGLDIDISAGVGYASILQEKYNFLGISNENEQLILDFIEDSLEDK